MSKVSEYHGRRFRIDTRGAFDAIELVAQPQRCQLQVVVTREYYAAARRLDDQERLEDAEYADWRAWRRAINSSE